jgi:2-polyprenyl-6-methoxyphenol hydroxylase-like FAD-dependent oxidoreductase
MSPKRFQVIIVGGGPVGVGLAIELGLRNISVALVERYPQPQPIPKGQNLTQRTMEHFYFWGIEDDLRAARVMPRDYPTGGVTTYGSLMSAYWYPWWKRAVVRPYYFTDNERLPQYETEKVLRRKLATLPTVTTYFGWSGEKIVQDEAGVQVIIVERDGNGQHTLQADYVVGCDGSHSTVREQAGIQQDVSKHAKRMVLLVFRSRELHERLKRFPEKSFYNVLNPQLEGYWQFFGRVDVGEGWFFHAPVPADTTKDNFDFRQLLYDAAGTQFACELDHIGFWDLRVAAAQTYQQNRVFIAGDSAHSHPPYGGYGINTGFEDARNLGWKLAAVLQGWGGKELLTSYTEERLAVFRSTAVDFIEAFIETDKAFLAQYNPEQDQAKFEQAWAERAAGGNAKVFSFEPHYEGSPIVYGLENGSSSARGSHQYSARIGHHLAPQLLSSGKNIFAELGSGFSLLALDESDNVVNAFARSAQTLNMPLKIMRDTQSDGREAYGASLILIRPDQFIAWCGDQPTNNVHTLMRKITGHTTL